jgi:predicted AAA+ superfamily ATPase
VSENEYDEFIKQVDTGDYNRDRAETAGLAAPSAAHDGQDWARNVASASCWAQSGDSFFPVNAVVSKVPPGAYRCAMSNTGPYIEKMEINIDHLLHLPDSTTEILLEEFNQFWKLKAGFDKRGFTFKRGMLMWGPPGSGKTSAVWQMTQRLIQDYNGVVVFVENPQIAVWCMTVLRRIEPTRPLITVIEDLDTIIKEHGEHHLLALLDGEFQLDNVVHLGTTNYPDLIPRRFIDRPSRFDTVMKVGMPSRDARLVYFKAKESELDIETLERWATATDGYSVAHLREVCIATQCFKQPEERVFARLNKMKQIIKVDEMGEETSGAGFLSFASNQQAKIGRRGH